MSNAQIHSAARPTSLMAVPQFQFTQHAAPQAPQQVQYQQPGVVAYPTAATYKQEDPRNHVYIRPDMYVGSDKRNPRNCWVYDTHTGKMKYIHLDYVPACERIFLEILANAADNVIDSRMARVDPGCIVIIMDGLWVSVTNNGLPIPIEKHASGMWVPELIFGNLLTSSKYKEGRHGIGKNGIGGKATNIFSKEFIVDIIDARNHKRYYQRWTGNMLHREEAQIAPIDPNIIISSVTVKYRMDFERFQYDPNTGYPAEVLALYQRHANEISFTTKVPVSFNGQTCDRSSIVDLAQLYYTEEQVKSAVIYYIWPAGTPVVEHKRSGWPTVQTSQDPCILPDLELMVLDTPDNSHHISFANSMMTSEGGSHVEGVLKVISDAAVKSVNEKLLELVAGPNKNKGNSKGKGKAAVAKKTAPVIDASEKRAISVTLADVRPHISLLLSVRVIDPDFDGQAKNKLMSPPVKVPIPEEILQKMEQWQLLDRLYAASEAKQFQRLTKDDGKKRRFSDMGKLIDANLAGRSKHSMQCILVVIEGDSAKGTAVNFFSHAGPSVRDYVGFLPVRGKGLNVMGKSPLRILKNAEIKSLKAALGLQENVNYLDPVNYQTLRYGKVYFMSDADDDGKHITSIELNLFFCRYPSLLAAGFAFTLDTPYLVVKKGQISLPFYSEEGYQVWRNATPNYTTWHHRYIKGLGTLNEEEIKNEFHNQHVVRFLFDQDTPKAMQLAFHKKAADHRKEFIARWKSLSGLDDLREMPISTYIYQNWTKYSMTNIIRALPNLLSGMKRTHMKVIQACHTFWKGISFGKTYEARKIQSLVGHVIEKVGYHHGGDILGKVIAGMCQGFVGACNLPLMVGDGNIGSRQFGGSDAAAARYPSTRPSPMFPNIFRPEDQAILVHLEDDGSPVEPADFYPVVPLGLINGIVGIGTGHSSTTVNHHPLDCTHLIKLLLTGTPFADLPDLIPHYIGFTGTLHVVDRNAKKRNAAADTAANPVWQWVQQQELLQNAQPVVFNFEPNAAALAEAQEGEQAASDDDEEDEVPFLLDDTADDEDDDQEIRQRLSLITRGVYRIQGNRIIITELPIGMTPARYYDIGQVWLEEKECKEFIDRSSPSIPYFEIEGFKNTPSYANLRLESSIPMSNMRFLNHLGHPVRYDNSLDILYAFYCQRLPKYQLRKNHMVKNLAEEVEKLNMRMKFINLVVTRVVDINNRPEEDIEAQLAPYQIDWKICRDIKVWNLSAKKITELAEKIAEKTALRDQIINTTIEQMWLNDIDDFEKAYVKMYGPRQGVPTNTGGAGLVSTPWADSYIATTNGGAAGPSFSFAPPTPSAGVQFSFV